jgi:hypothetical protein
LGAFLGGKVLYSSELPSFDDQS